MALLGFPFLLLLLLLFLQGVWGVGGVLLPLLQPVPHVRHFHWVQREVERDQRCNPLLHPLACQRHPSPPSHLRVRGRWRSFLVRCIPCSLRGEGRGRKGRGEPIACTPPCRRPPPPPRRRPRRRSPLSPSRIPYPAPRMDRGHSIAPVQGQAAPHPPRIHLYIVIAIEGVHWGGHILDVEVRPYMALWRMAVEG